MFATDLDQDGDSDVLIASQNDDKVAWYENLGAGSFGPEQVLSTTGGAFSVLAEDFDGDGDADVISDSGSSLTWFENLGGGAFGPQIPIPGTLVANVRAADVDGDGALDIVSHSGVQIAWYRNLGAGMFGPQHTIVSQPEAFTEIAVADLDLDGDVDVLSTSRTSDQVAWYQNLGGGAFGPPQVLLAPGHDLWSVCVADTDGDGDCEVFSAGGSRIYRHENLGSGAFGTAELFSHCPLSAEPLRTGDVDGDGDQDLLFGYHRFIALMENLRPRSLAVFGVQSSPGAPVFLRNANLTPGHEYYNLVSPVTCNIAPGNGPFLGLCIEPALLGRLLAYPLRTPAAGAPIPNSPFHFLAPSPDLVWGPYPPFSPPAGLDLLCVRRDRRHRRPGVAGQSLRGPLEARRRRGLSWIPPTPAAPPPQPNPALPFPARPNAGP